MKLLLKQIKKKHTYNTLGLNTRDKVKRIDFEDWKIYTIHRKRKFKKGDGPGRKVKCVFWKVSEVCSDNGL